MADLAADTFGEALSTLGGRDIRTPSAQADFDCTACGACCVHAGEVVVSPRDDTPAYLTRSVRGVVGFASWEADEFRRMAKDPSGRCIALKGDVGKDCSCRAYHRRPRVCREFEPGTEGCLDARATVFGTPRGGNVAGDAQ